MIAAGNFRWYQRRKFPEVTVYGIFHPASAVYVFKGRETKNGQAQLCEQKYSIFLSHLQISLLLKRLCPLGFYKLHNKHRNMPRSRSLKRGNSEIVRDIEHKFAIKCR